MKITEMPAYKRLEEMFEIKRYSLGIKDNMPIYCWDNIHNIPNNITPGHYVYAIEYEKIKLSDVPQKYRTREFFLHALSGTYKDIVEYVKIHKKEFDKQFFKDHIATKYYSLEFELNDFEYMPIEFIDEEMVVCAMFKSIDSCYVDIRDKMDDWFYSVYKRKPEVLTQDIYILGARCFASKRGGKNKFLDITPKEYRTPEYYFALCLGNRTPVMEDIPEDILTTQFLVGLLNESAENIQCFTEKALEREAPMEDRGNVKFWQAAIINDGYQIKNIPLNDERVEFFLSLYDKDSGEYMYGFKDHYKEYIRQKNGKSKHNNDKDNLVGMMTLMQAMSGVGTDVAIESGNDMMHALINRQTNLPINYEYAVPMEYCKKYDREEYLLEIYKKIGIKVIDESDSYYYNVVIPENISVEKDDFGYSLKDDKGETLIHYYDVGPFYDRKVVVDMINVNL